MMAVGLDLRAALREKFGFEHCSTGSRRGHHRVMAGEDTLAILATGAGKSAVLPAAGAACSRERRSSSRPLIALMKDQLDMLPSAAFNNNVALNSTLSEDQEAAAIARIASGEIKIVFVTPEKLEDDAFVALAARR
jgi:ATP-dependent DNA helicase RecQ